MNTTEKKRFNRRHNEQHLSISILYTWRNEPAMHPFNHTFSKNVKFQQSYEHSTGQDWWTHVVKHWDFNESLGVMPHNTYFLRVRKTSSWHTVCKTHTKLQGSVREKTVGNDRNKPVGDWISAHSPNFVAMATMVGPATFCMVLLNLPCQHSHPFMLLRNV